MELNTAQLLAVEYVIAFMGLLLGYKCFYLKKDNMNYFMKFVIVLNVYLLENIPIRFIELHLVSWNPMLVFVLYALSILLMTFSSAYWNLFVSKQLNSRFADSKVKERLFLSPAYIMIPLCVLNYWTGWLYTIDENGWYTRGSIFILQSLIAYIYVLVMVISCFIHLIKDEEKTLAKRCLVALAPGLICSVLQIVYGGSYLLMGILITGWIMYVEIGLDKQKAYELSDALQSINDKLTHSNKEVAKNMKTILALSDIYYVLYEADLVNDTFTEIKAPAEVSVFCKQFISARECMKSIPKEMFAAAYVGLMETFFDPDSINESLENTNSYFVDAVGKFKKDWVRTTMIATERDEEGNVTRVVFSLQEIGEIIEQQKKVEEAKIYEIHANEMKELFIQTAEALAGAIDAKDKYTHGHSIRVARYSRKIAELSGMSESECEKIYFAAMLHDVGKIGIPDNIISKTGKLTAEEYDEIKQHPVAGKNILNRISRLPYLSVGANYHHERFDGKGYPLGLKGDDIPEMARVIAVADAYDAMTSKRSYRNPIPQQTVREEIVKGMETQFDPNFAKIMVHLIDKDIEYQMKDNEEYDEETEATELLCEEYRTTYSQAIRINDYKSKIHFRYEKTSDETIAMPAFVFFDSLDSAIHKDDGFEEVMFYHEYGELKADGSYIFGGVRKTKTEVTNYTEPEDSTSRDCDIEIVKVDDHIHFELRAYGQTVKTTMALPDSTRFVYVTLTGEHCQIRDIEVEREETATVEDDIERIAEKISFLSGVEGNIPSIQIDGWRSATTKGILLDSDKEITFDMKSLPFARLLWHCPFIIIYHSVDGTVNGKEYAEYALIRLDGECLSESEHAVNKSNISKTEEFAGWNEWKRENIEGRHCTLSVHVKNNKFSLKTSNGGINIENETDIHENVKNIYIAITGDQSVIENINVKNM